ncbi:hydrolase [Marinobacterium zhoushanense]|uniref:Hydrolase n=1 Tax=Marinobacterium zhoushanense TaxID=1679163 RepID=A0ABQ1K240_9GAMM|nr:amidohydrolase family protein [Marinobacterium zhoushanense]GGB85644.1 hydrolase [Marinobacterium zhoushanense]
MTYIDTHTHVWSAFSPFVQNPRYTPAYTKTMAMLFSEMESAQVDKAVLVQPSYLGTDNQYLLSMLELWPERLRGVAVVEPTIEEDAFRKMVEAGVKGVRFNLVGHPNPADILNGANDHLFSLLKRYDCHLEIQMPGQSWVKLLEPLLARGLTVVADHFGLPEKNGCATIDVLDAGLKSDQLWIKLSGPYRFKADPAPVAARFAATALDRLLWGSDFPWTQHEAGRTYTGSVTLLRDWLGDGADQVLGENATKCFNFD